MVVQLTVVVPLQPPPYVSVEFQYEEDPPSGPIHEVHVPGEPALSGAVRSCIRTSVFVGKLCVQSKLNIKLPASPLSYAEDVRTNGEGIAL